MTLRRKITRNVQERDLLQKDLAESRNRYFELYEFAPIAYITVTESGKILESNLTAATMFGVDPRDLQGKDFARFVSPKSRPSWRTQRQAAFSRRVMRPYEFEMRRADGTSLNIRMEGRLFGRSNERRCAIALIDITPQKTRVTRPASQARLEAEAIENLGESIMITQGKEWRDSTVVLVNSALCRMTGYTAEQLLRQPQSILQGEQTQLKALNRVQRELAAGRSCRMQLVQYRKDGKPYDVELSISPLPGHKGTPAYVSVQRDVTAQHRTQLTLDQYRKDLKIMASELMLAEEHERQQLAEELHDVVSQALFRARIKLDELSIPQPKVREIAAILEEIGKMANTLTFELSPIVLYRLGLRHAIRSLATNMQQRNGLSIDIHDYDDQEFILSERVALALFRSVRELLANIARHAKTNKARLSLRRINNTLQIEIEDRGRGFDLEDMSSHVESGHLGLFSIRERLEYLGGALYIRSAPGEGTTAILTAPLSLKKAAAGSGPGR